MTETTEWNDSPDKNERPTHRVRLPGFITDEKIGLGDVINQATSYFGIQTLRSMRTSGGYTQPLVGLHESAAKVGDA